MRKLAVVLLWSVWLGCRAEDSGSPEDTTQVACAASEKPTCCMGCTDSRVQAVCTQGSWSCPAGATDQRQCPGTAEQPACMAPAHPQQTYTYPGCANEDYGCPRMKTVYCALETLRAEHKACQQDSDCVAAGVDGRCTGYGECPPPMVNVAGRADFAARAAAEVARYCGDSPMCASTGQCAYPAFVPRCQQGSCVAEPADGGS